MALFLITKVIILVGSATHAAVPMRDIGPVCIKGEFEAEVNVPLATYESPLWPSTNRGARITREAGGINVVVLQEVMTRSIAVQTQTAVQAAFCQQSLTSRFPELQAVVASTSRYAKLDAIHPEQVGNLLFLRLALKTGDAAGHNMVTKAADAILSWILAHYPECTYLSISGNYCTDKKVSAVNGILGRGKRVVADVWISRALCEKGLKTTPEAIVNLNLKKNYIGSTLAGSIRSANAHFANILLGFYLAFGQDAANIVEGSQGLVHAEIQNDGLYFSVTLPNVIVGTVGNGKHLDFVKKNLEKVGCSPSEEPGKASKKLAAITAATVLCGELSLLAAQTNPGELMRSHLVLERQALSGGGHHAEGRD